MSDPSFDDVSNEYRRQEAAKKAKAYAEMKKVLDTLRKNSMSKIVVEWDGHDDEGSITSVVFVKPDGTRSLC